MSWSKLHTVFASPPGLWIAAALLVAGSPAQASEVVYETGVYPGTSMLIFQRPSEDYLKPSSEREFFEVGVHTTFDADFTKFDLYRVKGKDGKFRAIIAPKNSKVLMDPESEMPKVQDAGHRGFIVPDSKDAHPKLIFIDPSKQGVVISSTLKYLVMKPSQVAFEEQLPENSPVPPRLQVTTVPPRFNFHYENARPVLDSLGTSGDHFPVAGPWSAAQLESNPELGIPLQSPAGGKNKLGQGASALDVAANGGEPNLNSTQTPDRPTPGPWLDPSLYHPGPAWRAPPEPKLLPSTAKAAPAPAPAPRGEIPPLPPELPPAAGLADLANKLPPPGPIEFPNEPPAPVPPVQFPQSALAATEATIKKITDKLGDFAPPVKAAPPAYSAPRKPGPALSSDEANFAVLVNAWKTERNQKSTPAHPDSRLVAEQYSKYLAAFDAYFAHGKDAKERLEDFDQAVRHLITKEDDCYDTYYAFTNIATRAFSRAQNYQRQSSGSKHTAEATQRELDRVQGSNPDLKSGMDGGMNAGTISRFPRSIQIQALVDKIAKADPKAAGAAAEIQSMNDQVFLLVGFDSTLTLDKDGKVLWMQMPKYYLMAYAEELQMKLKIIELSKLEGKTEAQLADELSAAALHAKELIRTSCGDEKTLLPIHHDLRPVTTNLDRGATEAPGTTTGAPATGDVKTVGK